MQSLFLSSLQHKSLLANCVPHILISISSIFNCRNLVLGITFAHMFEFLFFCDHHLLLSVPLHMFDSDCESSVCVCLSPSMCVRSVKEGRLPLILVTWHLANLISLACSGQPARIDTVCVCTRVHLRVCVCLCLEASGPVNATTLADGSNNGIREREKVRARKQCVRQRICMCVCERETVDKKIETLC